LTSPSVSSSWKPSGGPRLQVEGGAKIRIHGIRSNGPYAGRQTGLQQGETGGFSYACTPGCIHRTMNAAPRNGTFRAQVRSRQARHDTTLDWWLVPAASLHASQTPTFEARIGTVDSAEYLEACRLEWR